MTISLSTLEGQTKVFVWVLYQVWNNFLYLFVASLILMDVETLRDRTNSTHHTSSYLDNIKNRSSIFYGIEGKRADKKPEVKPSTPMDASQVCCQALKKQHALFLTV